jgi:hypothetical protein
MDTLAPLAQFSPTCKVCERGQLIPKKIFRMSGPVVVIGFILLIPSVLGMLAATLMFFGVIAYNGNESSDTTTERLNPAVSAIPQPQDPQSASALPDNEFRRACASGVIESSLKGANKIPTLPMVVQACECTLDASKEGNLSSDTTNACGERWLRGEFGMPDEKGKFPTFKSINPIPTCGPQKSRPTSKSTRYGEPA